MSLFNRSATGSVQPNSLQTVAGDWFSLFWTETDWQILVTNTNKYAVKQRTPDPLTGVTPRPLDGSWHPVTVAEMKAYVAIVLVLGVYRVRSYRDFWQRSQTHTHPLGNAAAGSRRRVRR